MRRYGYNQNISFLFACVRAIYFPMLRLHFLLFFGMSRAPSPTSMIFHFFACFRKSIYLLRKFDIFLHCKNESGKAHIPLWQHLNNGQGFFFDGEFYFVFIKIEAVGSFVIFNIGRAGVLSQRVEELAYFVLWDFCP